MSVFHQMREGITHIVEIILVRQKYMLMLGIIIIWNLINLSSFSTIEIIQHLRRNLCDTFREMFQSFHLKTSALFCNFRVICSIKIKLYHARMTRNRMGLSQPLTKRSNCSASMVGHGHLPSIRRRRYRRNNVTWEHAKRHSLIVGRHFLK